MIEEVPNRLINESSPYLLQHAHNPVNWYPWGEEAFAKAKAEDKPIFLSIGYSTCHWCHVMARESFEDENIAEYLNRYFVSVKVDREERPDIDSVYMAICQAFTGSGGWPTSIFMTWEQKPFFAGTYFPPDSRYGRIGFKDLLEALHEAWVTRRQELLQSAENAAAVLEHPEAEATSVDSGLIERAVERYKRSFDAKNGGFGGAPKFPAPHNLLFLINYYENSGDANVLKMAEKTLTQMYRGGLFDHVGGGFCRYSTDAFYLAPHFEKMLYDNALLIMAYCRAYEVTKNPFYRDVAQRTAAYVLREMTSTDGGGFYSAQDADSEGVEGKYYLFEPAELLTLLGPDDGAEFNRHYDVTPAGNFEGKSIPNLLKNEGLRELDKLVTRVYRYRRERGNLHLDDKVLTTWNSLMIAALCRLYRITADPIYLESAMKARWFIEKKLREGNSLFVSYRLRRGVPGFLDDYASYTLALLELYGATLNSECLDSARRICDRAIEEFWDDDQGGFFLSGKNNEQLMSRLKENYDGAMPSGNSLMAYVLGRLDMLVPDGEYGEILDRQLAYMSGEAEGYPTGYAMFLLALSERLNPPPVLTVVLKPGDSTKDLPAKLGSDVLVKVLNVPTEKYPLSNGETTYYVCMNNSCRPPVNDLAMLQMNK